MFKKIRHSSAVKKLGETTRQLTAVFHELGKYRGISCPLDIDNTSEARKRNDITPLLFDRQLKSEPHCTKLKMNS